MNAKPSYRIVFAGTPEFSVSALTTLLQSQHKVVAVYTQPDRPAGRGRKLTASPVKSLAQSRNIPVFQPASLRNDEEQKRLADLQADIMVVVAYGLILPKKVLETPRLGCLNIHASLLPRWRGAAPIQRSILEGDLETGITIMQMDEGLDTGAMLHTVVCPISISDTSEDLHQLLSAIGAEAILHTLDHLTTLEPIIQNQDFATYAHKITKEEAEIDWHQSADALSRKIRAFYAWPVAFTRSHDTIIRIWEANAVHSEASAKPGQIIAANADGIDIATSKGLLRILKCQLPGGRVLSVGDILNAKHDIFTIGTVLGK